MIEVECPYCGKGASLVDSKAVYQKSHGNIWLCQPCKAWVGVHRNSGKNVPLGTLANAETRFARRMAHDRFDPLWKGRVAEGEPKQQARGAAYAWLAEHLGIPVEECHIAMFDLKTCVRVVEIVSLNSYDVKQEA